MNSFFGVGLLGRDAEYKQTKGGNLCNFSVCCEERYKNKDGEWQTHKTWIECTKYGGNAESLAKVLTKGTLVAFSGPLRVREYEKDGQKRKAFSIQIVELKFGDPRKVSDGGAKPRAGAQAAPSEADSSDDMPF